MKLAKRVFRIDNVIKGVPVGSDHCRFNQEPLLKALKDIIQEYTGDANALIVDPNDQDHDFCPVFVVATEGQDAGGPVKLFRSYGFDKDQCPIWQAARATSAAPSYFPPAWVEIPAPGGWYIDGGLRRNNRSEVALSEARKYWSTVRRFCIVSIGTGIQKTVDFIEVSTSSRESDSEDSDGSEEEVKSSTSTGTFKRFKAAGNAISSGLVNIVMAVSKLPPANTAIDVFKVPGGVVMLRRYSTRHGKGTTTRWGTREQGSKEGIRVDS